MKTLVFDLDGTLVNFYGVEGWLNDLINENARPYEIAEPLWDMVELKKVLVEKKAQGWHIVVTSWLSKNSTPSFDKKVINAKLNWLSRYGLEFDEINIVAYGTPKSTITENLKGYQILVDDELGNRQEWKRGITINPTTENLIKKLRELY